MTACEGSLVLRCGRVGCQMFEALAAVHAAGAAHMDIKPENLLVRQESFEGAGTGELDVGANIRLRLADFGSAVDDQTRRHLFGPHGPSTEHQTRAYAPPEVLFGKSSHVQGVESAMQYDMWSAGVVMLEVLALGSPNAFVLHPRTHAMLERQLQVALPPCPARAAATGGAPPLPCPSGSSRWRSLLALPERQLQVALPPCPARAAAPGGAPYLPCWSGWCPPPAPCPAGAGGVLALPCASIQLMWGSLERWVEADGWWQGYDSDAKETIVLLRAMMEWCIYPPKPERHAGSGPGGWSRSSKDRRGGPSSAGGSHRDRGPSAREGGGDGGARQSGQMHLPVSWECTDDAIQQLIRRRDPTQQGLGSIWGVRLVRWLLSWTPNARPTAQQVLQHAFFRQEDSDPNGGFRCSTSKQEFEFMWECERHCKEWMEPAAAAKNVGTESNASISSQANDPAVDHYSNKDWDRASGTCQ
ncbi:hypothetical protein CYMTET_35022 [Cymbomonas tetramitiformis]|uniref:Protein kinase domain-containing protein n=1 Tax=Cymbomonas tetramitiformis TaxID=36881 RepID=A0AAE0FAH9_9CHLO|nr:hypothetical protein CYMTET_35022 [Cymbomonas tetramitiformis]